MLMYLCGFILNVKHDFFLLYLDRVSVCCQNLNRIKNRLASDTRIAVSVDCSVSGAGSKITRDMSFESNADDFFLHCDI